MKGRRSVHAGVTRLLSGAMVVLGLALIIQSATRGSGTLAARAIIGVLFVVAGVGRLWVLSRRGAGS